MKQNRLIFAICCLAMSGLNATAQQDSTAVNEGFFNAKDYLMQKRYVPQGKPVDKTAKGKNVSIGLAGGVSKLQGAGAWMPLMGEFGLHITKDVNSFNSYRATVMGGKNEALRKMGLEMDHIFRIQDYLTGWDPDRNIYIETAIGMGVYGTKPYGSKMKFSVGIHGGLIFTRRVSKYMDLYLEPRLNLFTDGIDAREAARKYDIGFQALAGLRYRMTKFEPIRNKDYMDNMFYEIYAGVQGDFSERVWNYMKMKSLGPTAGVAVGKWIHPLGVKVSVFGGWAYVPNDRMNDTSEEPYGGIRLEGMLNLNSLFMHYGEDHKFELNLSGGLDLGFLAHKGSLYSKKIRGFKGPTAALQALYLVRPDLGVFAQARWNGNKYSQGFVDGSVEHRQMKNVGLEFGVQYRRRYDKVEEMRRKYAFEPYNFVSVQVGTNFPFHTAGVTKNILLSELGQQFSISYGRRYSRTAAVRGTLEAARYGYNKDKGTYPLTIGADLMVDALALIGGYNDERAVNIYPFAGLLYTHNELGDENNFGIHGGADLMFRIDEKWGIYLEGAVRMYKGQITPSSRVYTSAEVSFVPNMSIGINYKF